MSVSEPELRSWEDRLEAVKAQFPSAADRYWADAVKDYDLMGGVLREVLRVGHTPKRRGQRPLLDQGEGMARLRQLWGDDYSTLAFPAAFAALAGSRSRSALVALIRARTGVEMSRTQVHRMLSGAIAPSGRDMEIIAAAFAKPATYFHEYRLALVLAAVVAYLDEAPEATASLVARLGAREA